MKSTRSSDMAVSFLGCHELGPAAGHELIGSVRLFPMSSRFWTMHQFTAPFQVRLVPSPAGEVADHRGYGFAQAGDSGVGAPGSVSHQAFGHDVLGSLRPFWPR